MGNYHVKKCHITGLDTENYPSQYDLAEYIITVNGRRLLFRFDWDHKNREFVDLNKHILYGMILNEKFPNEFNKVDGQIINNDILERLIREAIVPKLPEEKINHLLMHLHSLQNFEGSQIDFEVKENPQVLAYGLYFKNYEEMSFYLYTLLNKGFITGVKTTSKYGDGLVGIKLTYEGLSKVIEISDSGFKSNRCFVAMSFSSDQKDTRKSIKAAIISSGYSPILIDEQHFDSEVTINDALIAEIRKSKFVVADFTEHKHGVYFETGFALGLKRPVIYLCSKEDFDKTHFDTNHYPHIRYDNLTDLEQKLKTKIEAWIN